VVAATTVLLGTLYPLLVDALGYGKISVGPPYFNAVFIPIMSLLFIVMGIGPMIRWKKAKKGELRKQLIHPSVLSIVFGLLFPIFYGGEFNALVAMGITLASWVFLVVIKDLINQYVIRSSLGLGQWGMTVAHAGIAVTIVGVTLVSSYESETNVKMLLNESVEIAGYQIEFKGIKHVEGPNYSAEQGQINVYEVNIDGENDFVTLLKPERRSYRVQSMGMTEAGIDGGLFRDIYVALGDPLEDGAWAIRVHYKPFVRWIWLGAIFMSIGGILAILDKRYRVPKKDKSKAAIASNKNVGSVNGNTRPISESS
jgi:cytochrome c-type biogenesis protein CcmF